MKPLPRRELIRLSRRSFIKGSTALITSSLLLPRKSRAWTHGGGGGGGGYVAKAVHFASLASVDCALTTGTDSPFLTAAIWFRLPAGALAKSPDLWDFGSMSAPFAVAPEVGFVDTDDIGAQVANDQGSPNIQVDSSTGLIFEETWYCHLMAANTNFDSPGRIFQQYLGDISAVSSFIEHGDTTPFNMPFSGGRAAVPVYQNNRPFFSYEFECADLQIYPVFTDLSIEANRRLFFDADGKPVNPSVAVAALGDPFILLSGDASGFPINQGTGGTFTLTGTLTNASSSPSG